MDTLVADTDEAGSMAVQLKQGYSIISRVQDMVDTFNDIQQIASALASDDDDGFQVFLETGTKNLAGAARGKGGVTGFACAMAQSVGDLIPGGLKGVKNYPSELDHLTKEELEKMSKQGESWLPKQIFC